MILQNNLLKYLISYLILFTLLFLIGELGLRLFNFTPYYATKPDIKVLPGGTYVQKDSILGYRHLPGKFQVILQDEYSFETNHLPNTLRITHPIDSQYLYREKPELWIMGCSIMHGWGVNDHETFPWKIQENFPEYEVINWGVSGYGTVHSLLQLEHNLAESKPKVVVLAYGKFHQQRNVFSRERRRHVMSWGHLGSLNQPYARINSDDELVVLKSDELIHTLWPGAKTFRMIYYGQALIEKFLDFFDNSKEVTEQILLKMKSICKQNNIQFILANIEGQYREETQAFCEKNGILFVDISWEVWDKKFTNHPYDGHPNAEGHSLFAEKMIPFLKANLAK
jgi:lysophospholipase L1-like esterase